MKWMKNDENPLYPVKCSECETPFTVEEEAYNFCPYCGSRIMKDGEPQYEEVNEVIGFVGYCEDDGTRYELYIDDYGQCFYVVFYNKKGERKEISFGTYCDYEEDLEYVIKENRYGREWD